MEFGTCQFAVIADAGCDRTTELTRTSILGIVYEIRPRRVVCQG
jgi:hypothetical protein